MTPTARRRAVGYLQSTYAFSQRRACRTIWTHRAAIRCQRRVRADEPQLRERLRTLAAQRPRWGYRRLHILLKRELDVVNRKRVYRHYLLEGLALWAIWRPKRKRVAHTTQVIAMPSGLPHEVLAMDFMQDVPADGRRFRTFNILDTVTRQCLTIEVDT